MLILPKSIEVVTKYDVFGKSISNILHGVKVSKCQSVKVIAEVSFWALINNIIKIYYLLAGIFVARNEFDTLTP